MEPRQTITLTLIVVFAVIMLIVVPLYVSWKDDIQKQCVEWSGVTLTQFSDMPKLNSTYEEEQRYLNCMYVNGIDLYPKPPPQEPQPLWKAKLPNDGNRTG